MSVVVGFGFPEEAILISDSRVSFDEPRLEPRDEIRKIYQLGKHLTVGFTSQHVQFTLEILRRITNYSLNKSKSQATLYLLDKVPKVARYFYNQLSEKVGWKPPMEIVYAGVVTNRYLGVSEQLIFDLMKNKGGGHIPTKIAIGMQNTQNGIMNLPPPSPVVTKQIFPSGEILPLVSLGFVVSGTGSGIAKKIQESEAELFFADSEIPMRLSMIRMLCDDYIKEASVDTIGGLVQILKVNEKGIFPMIYSRTNISPEGKEIKAETLSFVNGEWIMEYHQTGKIIRVKQNPLIMDIKKNVNVKKQSWAA